jgi:hypothetical protein
LHLDGNLKLQSHHIKINAFSPLHTCDLHFSSLSWFFWFAFGWKFKITISPFTFFFPFLVIFQPALGWKSEITITISPAQKCSLSKFCWVVWQVLLRYFRFSTQIIKNANLTTNLSNIAYLWFANSNLDDQF